MSMHALNVLLRLGARPLLPLLRRRCLHTAGSAMFLPDPVNKNAQSYLSWDPSVPVKVRTEDNHERKDVTFRLVQVWSTISLLPIND